MVKVIKMCVYVLVREQRIQSTISKTKGKQEGINSFFNWEKAPHNKTKAKLCVTRKLCCGTNDTHNKKESTPKNSQTSC